MSPFSDEQQDLYRAYSQCYLTEANRRCTAFLVDSVFAAIATAIGLIAVSNMASSALDSLTTGSAVAALIWLTIRETDLLSDSKEHRRTAVTIQEQFDLTFWKSDKWHEGWNYLLCGDPFQPRTIKELSHNYKGEPLADPYWVNTTDVPQNDAALLRIQQSAAWGAKGHKRYARLNKTVGAVGLIVVLVTATVIDLATRDAATLLMAMAPFLVGRKQSARAHTSLAHRREELERHIQELLRSPRVSTQRDVRAAQDELCRVRLENRRIPAYLYNRYAARDREAIDTTVDQDAQLLRSKDQAGGTPPHSPPS